MTDEQMKKLKPGDLIRHASDGEAMVVTANYGAYVLAVRQAHVSNPKEWDQVDASGRIIRCL